MSASSGQRLAIVTLGAICLLAILPSPTIQHEMVNRAICPGNFGPACRCIIQDLDKELFCDIKDRKDWNDIKITLDRNPGSYDKLQLITDPSGTSYIPANLINPKMSSVTNISVNCSNNRYSPLKINKNAFANFPSQMNFHVKNLNFFRCRLNEMDWEFILTLPSLQRMYFFDSFYAENVLMVVKWSRNMSSLMNVNVEFEPYPFGKPSWTIQDFVDKEVDNRLVNTEMGKCPGYFGPACYCNIHLFDTKNLYCNLTNDWKDIKTDLIRSSSYYQLQLITDPSESSYIPANLINPSISSVKKISINCMSNTVTPLKINKDAFVNFTPQMNVHVEKLRFSFCNLVEMEWDFILTLPQLKQITFFGCEGEQRVKLVKKWSSSRPSLMNVTVVNEAGSMVTKTIQELVDEESHGPRGK